MRNGDRCDICYWKEDKGPLQIPAQSIDSVYSPVVPCLPTKSSFYILHFIFRCSPGFSHGCPDSVAVINVGKQPYLFPVHPLAGSPIFCGISQSFSYATPSFEKRPSFVKYPHYYHDRHTMRFSFLYGLLALGIPFVAAESEHAPHWGRRHHQVARRARGELDLSKRQSYANARFTFYDVGL